MKIKNGDKVRLKNDLVVGESYDRIVYLDSMTQFEGKVFTAIQVDEKNRTCRILDSKYYPFTYSFAMLELVEYNPNDLLEFLLSNSGKTKEQLVEEYHCAREKEHSQKALEIFFNKVIHASDHDSCDKCIINNLYMKCNTDNCMIISTLNVLIKYNLLDLDRFNDMFSYNDDKEEKRNDDTISKKQVDWTKVPFGTKVVGWWEGDDKKYVGRLLAFDKDGKELPFFIFVEHANNTNWFDYCELL